MRKELEIIIGKGRCQNSADAFKKNVSNFTESISEHYYIIEEGVSLVPALTYYCFYAQKGPATEEEIEAAEKANVAPVNTRSTNANKRNKKK